MKRDLESRRISAHGYRLDARMTEDATKPPCYNRHCMDSFTDTTMEKGVMKQHPSSISFSSINDTTTEEFHSIDLGPRSDNVIATSNIHPSLTPASNSIQSTDGVPLVDLDRDQYIYSSNALAAPTISSIQIPPAIGASCNTPTTIMTLSPTWHTPTFPAHHQTARSASGEVYSLASHSHLASKSRHDVLSFYDDLLSNISTERMMYASALSSQVAVDTNQQTYESDSQRRGSSSYSRHSPSVAMRTSIPLTRSINSNYSNQNSSERPIHPFDLPAASPQATNFQQQPYNNTMFTEQDQNATRAGMYIHLDTMDILENTEPRLQNQGIHSNNSAGNKRLSQNGSSHSQEAIENWRIHVAPSSPTLLALGHDEHEGPSHYRRSDNVEYQYGGGSCNNRRGTIPIILSSQLQETAINNNAEDDNLYFSLDDLHIPRPAYAYGHTRAHRQGSVNSSIGGYNYSTAASSPSLADSLSNPMYQQQSNGLMNASIGSASRIFPPRKYSLPSSINSSVLGDTPSQHHHQQQPQSHPLHHLGNPAMSSKSRTKIPSHLSNMMSHDLEPEPVNGPQMMTQEMTLSQLKSSHRRSQSQGGVQSRVDHNNSTWGLFGPPNDAQVGYTTTIDIPTASTSRLSYNSSDRDSFTPQTTRNGISLKEILAMDNAMHEKMDPYGQRARPSYTFMQGFNGEVDDNLVHPLDLSPLTRIQMQPDVNQESSCQNRGCSSIANPSSETCIYQEVPQSNQQQAWDGMHVGLGLTTGSTRLQRSPLRSDAISPAFVDYTPQEQHLLMTSTSTTAMTTEPMTRGSRPEMTSQSGSYAITTNASNTTLTNNDYENEMTRHQQQRQAGPYCRGPAIPAKQEPNNIQRQPSQRNKKNLVVNIVPVSSAHVH
ncbi:hypothetical protein BGZ50_004060 [Haplosporangium sp. Z 11]|nr:hypothetical protein BGZ50_004060 [Haplosporangium sp. Z 11]